MSQNIIDITLDGGQLAELDATIAALQTGLQGLIALTPEERRQLNKMGDKSEAFCRQAVDVFSENPNVLPRNFDLDAFRRDLATLDALRPRLMRLARLSERGDDTLTALGSDLMTNALEGYAVLKVAGRGAGLDGLRRMLSARFSRGPRAVPDAPLPASA